MRIRYVNKLLITLVILFGIFVFAQKFPDDMSVWHIVVLAVVAEFLVDKAVTLFKMQDFIAGKIFGPDNYELQLKEDKENEAKSE